jgi:drug/metabolite transporter (DMT)-like permease
VPALALPALASILYVVAVLFLKQAAGRGAGIWRATFVANQCCGAAFLGLWALGGRIPEPSAWAQPALTALLFLGGQVLGFLAIERGDVSIATPVMGVKIVLVAIGVTLLLGETLPAPLWAAAVLSSAGIFFMSRGTKPGSAARPGPAILFGILAAAAFALFDVLVQKWAPAWGAGRFLPVMMGCVALYSFALIPLFPGPLRGMEPGVRRPLLLGSGFIAAQAVCLVSSLALYRAATEINVVYSMRGLWSVLAVWILGPRFGNREREQGAPALAARLLGAAFLTGAVVLALLPRAG